MQPKRPRCPNKPSRAFGRGLCLRGGVLRLVLAIVLGLFAFAAPAAGQIPSRSNVAAELHAARAAIAPGERFTVVLRQRIRPGWHTYWRNPGDSGQPTALAWDLPPGFRAGPLQWPAPEVFKFATLVNYVYSGEVLFPIEITAPRALAVGRQVTLNAHARWLACSDICIPEEAALQLTLEAAAQGRDDAAWTARIAAAAASLPQPATGEARITAGDPAVLSMTLPGAPAIRNPHFFPYSADAIDHAAPEEPRLGPSGLSFRLKPGAGGALGAAPLSGVVAFETNDNGAWRARALEINATPGAALAGTDAAAAPITSDSPLAAVEGAPAATPVRSLDAATLMAALGLAFMGGLILNLMPCVLPVLSIKALSLAGGAHAGEARRHGLFYLAGVLATFVGLAILIMALRAAGQAAGWGFQLQAPWVTAGLALLFFAIGLNLLGVFAVGARAQGLGAALAARGGGAGAFFTGALAVVAATPCTAPFMAGAIGTALTQSEPAALAIFAALGLGFALPLVALSFAPALQRLLPKPGPWMERARAVLAFPMFGAAAWLAWVLAQQGGALSVLALLVVAIALAFALLVARWSRAWLMAGLIVLAACGAWAWRPLTTAVARAETADAWSEARLGQLRSQGRPVFVNFTAAWCLTCKVNEATTLSSPRVQAAFRERGVVYLVGDWTNRDDAIEQALAAQGRAGVPLYLYYRPEAAEPVVLPQILSERAVLDAIGAQ